MNQSGSSLFRFLDKGLLGAALVLLLVSAYFTFARFKSIDRISSENVVVAVGSAKYKPKPAVVPSIESVKWRKPLAQSAGTNWVYDVFTPPVIYYNPVTLSFTVSPPKAKVSSVVEEDPFRLELLSVRQQQYRVQLVGYVGQEGSFLCTLEDVVTGNTYIVRPGEHVSDLDVTLEKFDLKRVISRSAGETPIVDDVATAVLHDDRDGKTVVLNNREKARLPVMVGVFKIKGKPIIRYEIKEGGTIHDGDAVYAVNNLYLNPPKASVTLTSPDLNLPIFRTITPIGGGKSADGGQP